MEKVVKALECLKEGTYCECCDYKPYDDCIKRVATDALALFFQQGETIKELQNAYGYLQKQFFETQDKLLKQEAVEPKKENDGNPEPWTAWWYVCGDCGQPIDRMDRYCRNCGKHVKLE